MAGRKVKSPKTSSSETHAFVVVLEEMRAHFKVFGEDQQLLREQMSAGFEEVNRRFEAVDRRFDRVENDITEMRHDIVEIRHDIAEVRGDIADIRGDIADIRHDVGRVKTVVLEHSRELKENRVSLDKKVDRDEVEGIAQGVVARGR